MLTDLAPHQQAAAIVMRLGGAARELARTISPQELVHGGVVNGVQLDPVSYILHGLYQRFAQLGEKSRLIAMNDMPACHRKPNERINGVLTRYEVVRQRTRNEGQVAMTIGPRSAAPPSLRSKCPSVLPVAPAVRKPSSDG